MFDLETFLKKELAKSPKIPAIDVPTLLRRLAKGEPIGLLDIRKIEEQSVSTLPGAVPYSQEWEKTWDKGVPIVVYGTVGTRSALMAESLRNKGFICYSLRGGMVAWAWSGHDFSCEGHPTKWVHTYKKRWLQLPDTYCGVYFSNSK